MRVLLYSALLIASCQSTFWSDDFTLVDVDSGIEPAPIIVFADAPPLTRQAAVELADALERICGQRPELIDGRPEPLPDRAVWVGFQPVVAELFPKVDFEFEHPEEFLIAAGENHLVIAGRDRWDPDHLVVDGVDEKITGRQQEYGTANAVYTFLQDYLNVRWFWPGKLGEDLPQQQSISYAPFENRDHPQIRARGGAFRFSALSVKGYGRSHAWSRRQRLQLGSLEIGGGHAFGDWWDRFYETQPELFALQPDGTRGTYPEPRNVKLCQSNEAVWRMWLADVEAQLEKDPNQRVFNASPNDGWYSGHCVCEECLAWDHPDGEPRTFRWDDHQEQRPALSDRHVTFANRLAELLEQKYPGRDYYVQMLAYGHSRPAPIEARPADNVIMVSVANFFGRTALVDRGSSWGTTHREQFQAWGELAPHVMWRPNTGSPAGWQQGLPDLSVQQTIADIKFAAENHCRGIYIDSVWEHWATQGPQYYVMAQLIWDPDQDGEAILDDYYQRAFGPAAGDVRAYYELVETARMDFVAEHGYGAGMYNFPLLYTDELLAEAREHLDRAAAEVEDVSGTYAERVEFVRAGLRYTELVLENIVAMESYWKKKDDALDANVRGNWEAIQRICEQHPYAVNWGPVRPSTSRMTSLHPDHPSPKWDPRMAEGFDRN
ncbi:MAG: DUF4838 domain-containing protein [Planctomycetota bacterium]|nr:MAG: DUF4838 domain-containing protein [Planctomycetota bacterium]REJ93023.1 MAG: DUF4838 domain-containing protein [Planctomycetota bacterium]REK23261.1 MAG: DUF4838 domain-containing protein [Planctomycetota bacterium]REK30818.1 MAG: DUF4838 domain-containing protein [Planctomycetota bacterium]